MSNSIQNKLILIVTLFIVLFFMFNYSATLYLYDHDSLIETTKLINAVNGRLTLILTDSIVIYFIKWLLALMSIHLLICYYFKNNFKFWAGLVFFTLFIGHYSLFVLLELTVLFIFYTCVELIFLLINVFLQGKTDATPLSPSILGMYPLVIIGHTIFAIYYLITTDLSGVLHSKKLFDDFLIVILYSMILCATICINLFRVSISHGILYFNILFVNNGNVKISEVQLMPSFIKGKIKIKFGRWSFLISAEEAEKYFPQP